MKKVVPTTRTRVVREPHRGVYDRDVCDAILDEALVCHIGFSVDGQPYVIPTLFARVGDIIYFHGSAASRMLKHLGGGAPMSLTVTLVDGIVLARSVFSHSMNYRSVVVLGTATPIRDDDEKMEALAVLTEHLAPGRWSEARLPTPQELAATEVLVMPLDEASAKVRSGGPKDLEKDLELPVWAGVLPLEVVRGELVPADGQPTDLPLPAVARRQG